LDAWQSLQYKSQALKFHRKLHWETTPSFDEIVGQGHQNCELPETGKQNTWLTTNTSSTSVAEKIHQDNYLQMIVTFRTLKRIREGHQQSVSRVPPMRLPMLFFW